LGQSQYHYNSYSRDPDTAGQDINLRLSSLAPNVTRGTPTYPSTRHSIAQPTPTSSTPELTLTPLLDLANHLNDSLDIIDVTRWTGQRTSAPFISGQLRLLSDHLASARACLKGPTLPGESEEWWQASAPVSTFEPSLNPNLSLHFSIHDASLVLTIRTLSPTGTASNPHTPSGTSDFSLSGFNLRDRLFGLGHKMPTHDEMGEVFPWRGKEEVNVREKVRVESGDPSLISVSAKLSALEHEVKRWRFNLRVVMGEDEEEVDE
jgi:Rogdi leucine zipper containing protein